MVGFDGFEASSDVKRLIQELGVGGVILFARNVDAPEQVAELVRELQGVARDAGHDLPLLVAVDQEGGRVARLRRPWTVWPALRAVGRAGSDELARGMGKAIAAELKGCGIGCDFAPVVDVDTNPKNPVIGDRSFGADAEQVGRLGAAFIQGLQDGGVAASAKHFPGHGDTAVDSHLELPRIEHDLGRLEDVELRPFRHAVAAGVATIMTAHVLIPELDEVLPATLSSHVLGDLLRKKLGYTGVVVSDDLEMKAVAKGWKSELAAVLAAQAGCDLLLVCATPAAQVEAVEGLVRARERDLISWDDMDKSCERIRALKRRYLLPYTAPNPRLARLAAGVGEHEALAREIAERGGATV
jgi:beta-N-acetylhexosaminidase